MIIITFLGGIVKMKKELAKIKDARLSMGRNTFLTFWITLDYEGDNS
jgi:hypothetical protein